MLPTMRKKEGKNPSNIFDRILNPEEFFDFGVGDGDLFWGRGSDRTPSVNVQDNEGAYNIEVAAPGMEKDDMNVEIDGDHLVISSEKKDENEEKDDNIGYTRKEFSYRSFRRSFYLPEDVKKDNIHAKYENGVLFIEVPKKEETKNKNPTKKIEIE